jgi:hypothetical protein
LKRYDDLLRTTNLGEPGSIIYGEDHSHLGTPSASNTRQKLKGDRKLWKM